MSELQSTKKHEDLVYDVGMHKGEDTDYYIKKGFRVIGFEADPDLAEHCRNRFSNEIENGKLVIVEGAITELPFGETKNVITKFYKNNDYSVSRVYRPENLYGVGESGDGSWSAEFVAFRSE